MKICVTGGAGFIGKELIKKLSGHEIIVFDIIFENNSVFENNFDCLEGVEFCFHLGANSSTRASSYEATTDNVDFSQRLINACVKRNIPVVFSSSASIYGSDRRISSIPNPQTPYALSKHLTETFFSSSKNVVCLRYHNVYGSTEEHKGNMASIVSKWISRHFLKQTSSEVLFEGSDNIMRDFIHVDDINKINILFLDYWIKHKSFPLHDRIFDVGTGTPVSFKKVADTICIKTKAKYEYIPNPYTSENYQFYTKADIKKIKEIYKKFYDVPFKSMSITQGVNKVFNDYLCKYGKK